MFSYVDDPRGLDRWLPPKIMNYHSCPPFRDAKKKKCAKIIHVKLAESNRIMAKAS